MLKKIPIHQVRMGMFVQSLEGAWMHHPFWKNSFKLEDTSDLKKLLASKVTEITIDTSKGLDVSIEKVTQESNSKEKPEPLKSEESVHIKGISAAEECEQAKKVIYASKQAVASMFNDVRMGKAISAEAAMPLVEDITASVSRNESALISLVRLKSKDDYTYMHSVAVCALMVALGKQLKLSEDEIKQAGLAGLLHDIGKAGIPLEILNKPAALSDSEFDLIKLHPERGYALLIEGNVKDQVVLDVCLHHHEKIDGTGYPGNFQDEEISLFAKMGAVCDVYDAVTSNRPYKAGWEPGVSLQRMAQWKGHFDEEIFKAFVKSVGIYPVGTTVKLKSGKLGVVIDQSAKSLLTPIVKVFYSIKSQTRIPAEIIDLSKSSTTEEIIGQEDPTAWGITDVHEIWSQYEIW